MAWEKRGNRTYYYQKRREGSRVISEYVGTGRDAVLISRMEEILRDRAETERQVERIKREKLEAFDSELGQLCTLIQMLMNATLEAKGFHKHKGQWRRKRHERQYNGPSDWG